MLSSGNCSNHNGATLLSPRLATVNSAASGALATATARPCLAQGRSHTTKCRPKHPISPGKVCGSVANRRSQVRRFGKRPC
jgi:hypothetical protein